MREIAVTNGFAISGTSMPDQPMIGLVGLALPFSPKVLTIQVIHFAISRVVFVDVVFGEPAI